MGKPDANNIIAIGAASMGISAASIFICLCMLYGSFFWDTAVGLAIAVIILILIFFAGYIILTVGIILKLIDMNKKDDVKARPVNVAAKETTSAVNYEKPKDTSGKVICPHCGKEQQKNSFGCIFCHSKF